MYRLRKIGESVLLCLFFIVATFAISQGADQPIEIVYVNQADLWSLDPQQDSQGTSDGLFQNIYDPLWRIDFETGQPQPALAAAWEWLDSVTVKVYLRKDVRWHDGEPFTSADVKATFMRLVDNPDIFRHDDLEKFGVTDESSLEVIDDHTVLIHFDAPLAPGLISFVNIFIQPAHIDTELAPIERYTSKESVIGTGAYKLEDYKPGEYVKFVINNDWWGWGELASRKGRPDVAYYKPVPEDYSRYAALKTGEADIVGNIASDRIAEVEQQEGIRIESISALRVYYIQVNSWIEPFNDVRVRRALQYAIDMKAIVENILGGYATVHPCLCSGGDFGYFEKLPNGENLLVPYEYDPQKARELLAEAGYPNGFKTDYWSPHGKYAKDFEISQAVVGFLADVGIEVELHAPAWAQFADKWLSIGPANPQNEDFGIWLLSFGGAIPYCGDKVAGRLGNRELGFGGRYFSDPFLDALIQQERTSVDIEERQELWKYINLFVHLEAPIIAAWDATLTYGVNDTIEWTPVPVESVYLWTVKVITE